MQLGVPGADAASAPDVLVGELERAIIFWRTSRIFSCRHTLVGNASQWSNWNAVVAWKEGRKGRKVG